METEKKLEGQEIVTALAKENVTEAVIARFKANYLPLKINGLTDLEGYGKVKAARLECKNTRVLAEKICKKGREEAIKIQKNWVAKEKEITGQIRTVEDHLSKQEEWFDSETAKAKLIALRTQQLPARKEELTKASAIIPTDEVLLGMDDMAFMTYLNNERTRILNEKEAALKAKEREQEIAKINTEKGNDSLGMPYIPDGNATIPGVVFITGTPKNNPAPVIRTTDFSGDRVFPPEAKFGNLSDKEILMSISQQLFSIDFDQLKSDDVKKQMEPIQASIFDLSVKIANIAETI